MKNHICTCCKRRLSEVKMHYVYYSILHKHYWHCIKCLSSSKDIKYSDLVNSNLPPFNSEHLQLNRIISKNFRRIVKEKQTNITEIAKILNITKANLEFLIRENNNLKIVTLVKIGNAIGTDFRRLLYYTKKKNTKFQTIQPEKVTAAISKNIIVIIENQNLTKAETSRLLKIKTQTFSKILNPKNNPKTSTFIKIAKVLNVDLLLFFDF